MFCRHCGSQLDNEMDFCTNCGARQNPMQEIELDDEKTMSVFAMPKIHQEASSQTPVAETEPHDNETADRPVVSETEQTHTDRKPAEEAVQQAKEVPAQQDTSNPVAETVHNGEVCFGEAVALFFRNYVNFSGRASKSEYWWVFLFNVILYIPLYAISAAIPPLGGLCSLALMVPGISLAVRRLHDIGKSGAYWFMGMIPFFGGIYLVIQFLKDSDGDNQYGPGPNCVVSQQSNQTVNNGGTVQRAVTEDDIYRMVLNHAPTDVNTPEAKRMMDGALGRIIPTYTGMEDLAGAIRLCDLRSVQASITSTDTDTLLLIFKALDFYVGQGANMEVLRPVAQSVLDTLKTRFC